VDHNDNRQKDSDDKGLNALFELYNKIGDDSWHLYQNITADKSGNFSSDEENLDIGIYNSCYSAKFFL